MPDPTRHPQAETKRLRRAAKRRRRYSDDLRASVVELESSEPAFAARLARLADDQWAEASRDAARALEIEREAAAARAAAPYSSPQSKERAERALAAMDGRFAIDRARALAVRAGVDPDLALGAMVAALEAAAGVVHADPRPPMGARIDRLEADAGPMPRTETTA